MQKSEEQATRNGIGVLEQAFTSIQQRQQGVQSTAESLAGQYGGADGGKFKSLLEQWDGHVDTILVNLDRMVDELNNTLTEQGLVQGSSSDSIDQEYSRSTAVFDELNGYNAGGVQGGTNPNA
ncbi:WXG100 family type VII secretion target [Streptomyces mirabilis]